MILIAIHENDKELETIKQWADEGKKVYANLNGQAVLLLSSTQAQKATKSEVMNILKPFRFEGDKEEVVTQNLIESTSPDGTESPTLNEMAVQKESLVGRVRAEFNDQFDRCEALYDSLNARLSKVETALRQPLMPLED